MANVEDSIVSMFEEFLFSDSEMEELALYKHIEAVKKDNAFLFDSSDDDNGGGGNGGGRMPFFGGSNPKGGNSGDALRDAMFSAAGLNAPKG